MPNVNKLQVFNNEFFSLAASLDQIKASCKESSYFVNEATFQAKKRLALIRYARTHKGAIKKI